MPKCAVLSCFSHVQLFEALWTITCQASLSKGFSRQKYWSGLPFPSPGDLPDPGIERRPPALWAEALNSEPPGNPRTLRYDLNQIPYDYTAEVRNRLKGLDLIDRMPDELWMEVCDIVQETGIRPSPWKRNAKRPNGYLSRPYQ